MATKISAIPLVAGPLTGLEKFECVQGGNSKQVTAGSLFVSADAYYQAGETDDTLMFQRAVDDAAASGYKRVRGMPGKVYTINPNRIRWSEWDLHDVTTSDYNRATHTDSGASFSLGYWVGVVVPNGVIVEHAIFTPLTTGYDALKCPNMFGFGDATSATRYVDTGMRNCKTVCSSAIVNSIGVATILAQSVDNLIAHDNQYIASGAGQNEICAVRAFDCAAINQNSCHHVKTTTANIYEYCSDLTALKNSFLNCWGDFDLDKACRNVTIESDFQRTVQGTTSDNSFEANGCDGLVHRGNYNMCGSGCMYDGKGGLASTFVGGLNGTDAYTSYFPTKNVKLDLVVRDTYLQALFVGDDWANTSHNGHAGSSNFSGKVAIYNAYNSNPGVITAATSAAKINECDGFDFDIHIEGSNGHGVLVTSSREADFAGAGTYSITKGKLRGRARNCDGSGLVARRYNTLDLDFAVRSCGVDFTIAAQATELDLKASRTTGQLVLDDGSGTTAEGLRIGAATWTAGSFDFAVKVISKGYPANKGVWLTGGAPANTCLRMAGSMIDSPHTTYLAADGAMAFAGAPPAAPRFIGDIAYDSAGKNYYRGVGTATISDWKAATYSATTIDPNDISHSWYARHDCVTANNDANWTFAKSGTGTAFATGQAVAGYNALGIVRFALGTVATNSIQLTTPDDVISFGLGAAHYESRGKLLQLSNGVDTYTCRDGFLDGQPGVPTDGAFFRYADSVNGGKWQAVCRANGVETAVDTGVAAVAGTTTGTPLTHRMVDVDAAGANAVFTIDGAVVATIMTNIPTGTGRETGAGISYVRSAGTAGLNPGQQDFVAAYQLFTAAR